MGEESSRIEMKDKNLIWVVAILAVAIIVAGLGKQFLIDKIADRVIQKLQKDYSPSPYGPGIDPDKIDPDRIRN
jgi:hypothetical protein